MRRSIRHLLAGGCPYRLGDCGSSARNDGIGKGWAVLRGLMSIKNTITNTSK